MSAPICQNLKQLRLERGLTQEQLAQRVHLTRQAISSYESGRTQPNLDTLEALAEALDADILALLYGARSGRLCHWQKWVARITVALVFLCVFAAGGLQWAADFFYPIQGSAYLEHLSGHAPLRDLGGMLLAAACSVASTGGVITLVASLSVKPPVTVLQQIKWAALLGLGARALVLVPWGLLDGLIRHSLVFHIYQQRIDITVLMLLASSLLITLFRFLRGRVRERTRAKA